MRKIECLHTHHLRARFRTIQVYPKDLRVRDIRADEVIERRALLRRSSGMTELPHVTQ
jgi:hypothetical protein